MLPGPSRPLARPLLIAPNLTRLALILPLCPLLYLFSLPLQCSFDFSIFCNLRESVTVGHHAVSPADI